MQDNQYSIHRSGEVSKVIPSALIEDTLHVQNYKLVHPPQEPMQLVDYNSFDLPAKIYGGGVDELTTRILNTFVNTTGNLGVLLTGLKGTGKSVQLKHIAASSNMPVILIDQPHHGSELIDFLERLPNQCVVVFDEFEKVYNKIEEQESILPLLDGLSTGKHIFVLTVNGSVNEFLINRPSRIRYVKQYGTLDHDIIEEVVADISQHPEKNAEIIDFLKLFPEMNMDTVVSFITEANLYPEDSTSKIASIFNIENPMEVELDFVFNAIKVLVRPDEFKFDDDFMDMWSNARRKHFGVASINIHELQNTKCIWDAAYRVKYEAFLDEVVAAYPELVIKSLELGAEMSMNDFMEFMVDDDYYDLHKNWQSKVSNHVGIGDCVIGSINHVSVSNSGNHLGLNFQCKYEGDRKFSVFREGELFAKAKFPFQSKGVQGWA